MSLTLSRSVQCHDDEDDFDRAQGYPEIIPNN